MVSVDARALHVHVGQGWWPTCTWMAGRPSLITQVWGQTGSPAENGWPVGMVGTSRYPSLLRSNGGRILILLWIFLLLGWPRRWIRTKRPRFRCTRQTAPPPAAPHTLQDTLQSKFKAEDVRIVQQALTTIAMLRKTTVWRRSIILDGRQSHNTTKNNPRKEDRGRPQRTVAHTERKKELSKG